MSLFAVGDIHGCSRTLDLMLERIDPGPDDHLVFVGDYIDRGPDSNGVIERLLGLQASVRCTFLKGNHEALMLAYLDHGEYEVWRMNGGLDTLSSYQDADGQIRVPESHIRFIRDSLPYFETPEFFFVHGGIPPELSVADAVASLDEQTFLWERAHLNARRRAWEKVVVCGHTPRPEPLNQDDLIAIDTGCVYFTRPGMGRLTAVKLPERTFIAVDYAG
jgi:serine/threonine protein phosphatase 1